MDHIEERCFSLESGIGTIVETGFSSGSLDDLSHEIETEVSFHTACIETLQEKIEWLYEQLRKRDDQIVAQQEKIACLQKNLSSLHLELNHCPGDVSSQESFIDNSDRFRDDTISLLQAELSECQLQYTDCFEQLVRLELKMIQVSEENVLLRARVEALGTPKSTRNQASQTEGSSEIMRKFSPSCSASKDSWSLAWEVFRLNEELNKKVYDKVDCSSRNSGIQRLTPKKKDTDGKYCTVEPGAELYLEDRTTQSKLRSPHPLPPYRISPSVTARSRPRSCCFATLV